MVAIAGVVPQAPRTQLLVSMLEDSWYCNSLFKPAADLERWRDEKDVSLTNCEQLQKWSHSIDEVEIREIFGQFDSNCDGVISGDELRRCMGVCGIAMTDAEASSMIQSVDENRNGGIDFEEFSSLYSRNLAAQEAEEEDEKLLTKAFRVFDKNEDGFISAEELQTVLLGLGLEAGRSLKKCQRMISNVDLDGNGQCDIHEFRTMMSPSSLSRRSSHFC